MSNVYYSPEEWQLIPVADISYTDEPYSFDIRVVWYHPNTKQYYTAHDSGCSCPTPFEYYDSIDDLEVFNYDSIRAEAYRCGHPVEAALFLGAITHFMNGNAPSSGWQWEEEESPVSDD